MTPGEESPCGATPGRPNAGGGSRLPRVHALRRSRSPGPPSATPTYTAAFPVLVPRVLSPAGRSAHGARRHVLPDTQPPPAGSEAATPLGRRPRRRGLSRWQELPLLLVVAIVLALLVRTFLLQAFYIPSGSMAETLVAGDRVLVDKMVYRVRTPAVGEVVVFEGPEAWGTVTDRELPQGLLPRARRAVEEVLGVAHPGEEDYVKRVVGVGGDTVSCCDRQGRVVRNGVPLDEGYVADDSPLELYSIGDCRGRRFAEVEVREGHLFVLGDHRRVSRDSRCHGQVPVENVIGRAFAVVWPSDRWSVLTRPDTAPTSPRRRDGRGGAAPTPGLSRARKVVGSQSD